MKNTRYSVLIAEDKAPAREILIDFIIKRPELDLQGIARNGKEALDLLSEKPYDFLFLDIEMPHASGIEVLEKCVTPPSFVIFTTSYDKFAVKAFELCAIDYLLKPFSRERFDSAVDKALSKDAFRTSTPLKNRGLTFKEKSMFRILPFEDIIYLSSHNKKTIIHTDEKCFEINRLLKEIQESLPAESFIRIHKQYIINREKASCLEHILGSQYRLHLNDGDDTILPLGLSFLSDVKKRLSL